MPSVGMRRTRVFGVVKGVDGARVLRSGRRLWPESGEVKLKKSKDVGDWYRDIDDRRNGGGTGRERMDFKWTQVRNVKPKRVIVADIHDHDEDVNCVVEMPKQAKPIRDFDTAGIDVESCVVDRMYGKVYRRKKKRGSLENVDGCDDVEGDRVLSGDRMFGLRFIRRQRSKKTDDKRSKDYLAGRSFSYPRDRVLTILAENRIGGRCFSDFMLLVLRHLRSDELRVTKLASFLLSDPIHGVFASNGVQFLQDYPSSRSSGFCVIFGAMQSMPMFFLDFSALPFSFMHLHSRMFFRAMLAQVRLVNNSNNKNDDVDISSDSEEDSPGQHVHILPERSSSRRKTMTSEVDHPKSRPILHPSIRSSRLAGRNMQYKSGLSYRGIQKRRSSLRTRRPRNPSIAAMHKAISSVASESIVEVKRSAAFSSFASHSKLKNSAVSNSPALVSVMDIDSSCCTANILIVESDKCLREEGAYIMLELSASSEWLLVVKKYGLTRYTHKAEKVMSPGYCNRITHAMMWMGDHGWKLEFPNRQDWLIFKDLYKECSDRNVLISTAKTIPVPRVCEVPGYVDGSSAFCRPDSYISLKNDEVSRAMAKATANYDMDFDDEEWLNNFNDKLIAKDMPHECILEDNFELMIDAFEKGIYCNPDAFSNEKAPDLSMHLGSRQIIESVFTYWTKKRRQNKSSLIRVFQAYHAKKKPPVVPKPAMRRRRTLKRKPSQPVRVKQPNILQVIVPRQDALEDQNALLKFQEADASAKKSIESAVHKRQRAQLLLESADLAVFKATMALRIAEAIQVTVMPEEAASIFLE